MTPRKQFFHHRPEEESVGDCSRTAIACLLDLEPAAVPHWGMDRDWLAQRESFLAARGLAIVSVPYQCTLDELFALMRVANPGMLFILIGTSRTGVNHNVIASDKGIVWDPSLSDSGIIGPASDGYYWAEWLVPALMRAEA